MGSSSSSPRKISVNREDVGIITISENVVHRLHGGGESGGASTTSQSSGPKSSGNMQFESPRRTDTNIAELVGHSDLLSMRQAHEAEIRKLERSWKARIQQLEKLNDQLNAAASQKLDAQLSALEAKHNLAAQGAGGRRCDPICPEQEQKVIDCLQNNKSQPLRCSEVVKEYQECVQKARSAVLQKRHG